MKKARISLITVLFLLLCSLCVFAGDNEDVVVSLQIGNPIMEVNGAETEIDKQGTIGISVEEAAKLEFLLVPHGHNHMTNDTIPEEEKATNEKHAAFLVKSFFNILANKPLLKYITAVAHPFTAVGTPGEEIVKIHSYISDKQFEDCFEALPTEVKEAWEEFYSDDGEDYYSEWGI